MLRHGVPSLGRLCGVLCILKHGKPSLGRLWRYSCMLRHGKPSLGRLWRYSCMLRHGVPWMEGGMHASSCCTPPHWQLLLPPVGQSAFPQPERREGETGPMIGV